jgi:site-specific recombinase XerD
MAKKGKDMINRFYCASRVLQCLRSGPLGPYMDKLAALLFEQGYARQTGRLQLRLLGELSRWLQRRGLGVEDLDEQKIAKFLEQATQLRGYVRKTQAVLGVLLDHLRDTGILPVPHVEMGDTPLGRVEREFARYLVEERGLSQATVARHFPLIRSFLIERFGTGSLLLSELGPADVTRFVLHYFSSRSACDCKAMVAALRSFFRFLLLNGGITIDLAQAVPRAAYWRLSGVPKSLPAEQIERLLKSCDRSRPVGQRDYALFLLLARLGLRAGEVVAMRLEDLDWKVGELTVRGKGRRQDRLPMPQDVGEALAAYLLHGRPHCSTRRVFVRTRAPYRELAQPSSICAIFGRALERAGLSPAFKGTHLLRHSLASEMLRRGASLGEIGEILRHRLPSTTEIYAKVDLDALRTLAQPWPGGLP